MTRVWLPMRWIYGAVGGRVVKTVWTMPRRSSAWVSSAVWFCIPPMGSNLTPLPTSAEGGGSKTEQSLSTLMRVRSSLLLTQVPLGQSPAAFGPRPPLHTTLMSLLAGRRGEVKERALVSAPARDGSDALREGMKKSRRPLHADSGRYRSREMYISYPS